MNPLRLGAILIFGLACVLPVAWCNQLADASSAMLSGVVTSAEEGRMEGVLVSAKAVSGNVTVTVVSDSEGRYTFPANRLKPGKYRLKTRAIGYELEDPGLIEILPTKTATVDLKLQKTHALHAQLRNAEWLMSVPGTEQQKRTFSQCVYCHSLNRIVESRFDAKEWEPILNNMKTYDAASTPLFPVKAPVRTEPRPVRTPEVAEYLSAINLSSAGSRWRYELKTLPRPTGKATRVIITEYHLPRRDTVPHDAAVDPQGMVWYTDYAHGYLGRLNPETEDFKEWRVPVLKPEVLESGVDIGFDKQGTPWFAMNKQAAVAKFDRTTEEIATWKVPEKYNDSSTGVSMLAPSPDGMLVWFRGGANSRGAQDDLKTGRLIRYEPTPEFTSAEKLGGGIEREYLHRLDTKTGQIISYPIPAFVYGVSVTSQGNLVFLAMNQSYIGIIDARTGELSKYPTPTRFSGPRRGHVDAEDRFWFGEYWANKIGMFDTRTKQFKEWSVSIPWSQPYDAVGDKSGHVWSGGMNTDQVYRLNPKTGEIVGYLMPTLNVNIRRIDVDNSRIPNSCWIGDDHHATLVKIEPIE